MTEKLKPGDAFQARRADDGSGFTFRRTFTVERVSAGQTVYAKSTMTERFGDDGWISFEATCRHAFKRGADGKLAEVQSPGAEQSGRPAWIEGTDHE